MMRPGNFWLPLVTLLFAIASAFAHNPDTSYARVRIHADKIELRLTFDVLTLQRIVPTLDANNDRALGRGELLAAAPVVQAWLQKHVGLEVDGAAASLGKAGEPFWPLDAPEPMPAAMWHEPGALISFPFDTATTQPTKSVALLFDVFEALGERHIVLGVFENGGQSRQVVFTAQEPDCLHELARTPSPTLEFLWQGALHIWVGYDHIAFLLALLVVSRLRQLVVIVTSFTIAHSITLFLAAMKYCVLPGRLIECAIAATIVHVAAENLLRRDGPRHRWVLTFVFGLIHGFGFANVLGGLELPPDAFVRCLLLFNAGVELGQLAIVLAAFPLLAWAARAGKQRAVTITLSVIAGLLGLAWLVDRVFELEMMPF